MFNNLDHLPPADPRDYTLTLATGETVGYTSVFVAIRDGALIVYTLPGGALHIQDAFAPGAWAQLSDADTDQ